MAARKNPAARSPTPAGRPVPPAWSAALALGLFAAYLALMPSASGGGDASELTLVLATGGVIHPTGYPIFTILGHVYVTALHALGLTYPIAANSWAAVGAGVAMYFYHRLALRVVGGEGGRFRRFCLAALPALALAFNPVWLEAATLIEVTSWHLAWVCGACTLCLWLIDRIQAQAPATPIVKSMAGWGLACGLGGVHHSTSIFVAGALTGALAWTLIRARRFHAWVPVVWLGAGLIPLLAYGYIYWKAAHPGGGVIWPMLQPGWRGMIQHVTGQQYQVLLGGWHPAADDIAVLRSHVYPFLWPGLAILLCFGVRDRIRRIGFLSMLAAAAMELVFVYRYGVADPSAYFVPPLAIAWLALVPLGQWLLEMLPAGRAAPALAGLAATALLVAAAMPGLRLAFEMQAAFPQLDTFLRSQWASIPYDSAIVLWPSHNYYYLKEFQRFEGLKPALDVCNPASLANDVPARRFQERYGFDPRGRVDAAHLALPVKRDFVFGQASPEFEERVLALVNQQIAESSPVPVIAFDPPRQMRAFLRKTGQLPPGVTDPRQQSP